MSEKVKARAYLVLKEVELQVLDCDLRWQGGHIYFQTRSDRQPSDQWTLSRNGDRHLTVTFPLGFRWGRQAIFDA